MRLIDADAIRFDGTITDIVESIMEAQTIEAEPVVRGKWNGWRTSAYIGIDEDGEPKFADRIFYRCSECRYGTAVKHNYCPNCGARMGGDT